MLSSIFTIINKLSGIYGLIALLDGGSISALQSSMYLYSTSIAVPLILLHQPLVRAELLPSLIYAHIYTLDAVVGFVYSLLFTLASDVLTQESLRSSNEAGLSLALLSAIWVTKAYSCYAVLKYVQKISKANRIRHSMGTRGSLERLLRSTAPSFWGAD